MQSTWCHCHILPHWQLHHVDMRSDPGLWEGQQLEPWPQIQPWTWSDVDYKQKVTIRIKKYLIFKALFLFLLVVLVSLLINDPRPTPVKRHEIGLLWLADSYGFGLLNFDKLIYDSDLFLSSLVISLLGSVDRCLCMLWDWHTCMHSLLEKPFNWQNSPLMCQILETLKTEQAEVFKSVSVETHWHNVFQQRL